MVPDLACCSSADADFVCNAEDNKCADLPVANVNLISCCSGANPTVPGIPTDAPVEPTASSTMSTMSTDSSSSGTSTEAVVTDENGVTVTEGTTDSSTESSTESGASSVVMASVFALLAAFYH